MTKQANMSATCASWKLATIFMVGATFLTPPSYADKPSWAGKGKNAEKGQAHKSPAQFGERERRMIRSYFGKEARKGKCPPGLARKNNGCMPPGQAKKWEIGSALTRDVIFHELPRQLIIDLGPPPSGYKYVRVAEDILMIAVGTGMVMDAVKDIGKILQR